MGTQGQSPDSYQRSSLHKKQNLQKCPYLSKVSLPHIDDDVGLSLEQQLKGNGAVAHDAVKAILGGWCGDV